MKNSGSPSGNSFEGSIVAQRQESESREIDFIKLSLRYKWLLLAGLIGGLVLGELGYQKLGPSYDATVKLLVSKKAEVPIKDTIARSYGERAEHVALIMSPMIIARAVEMHQLDQLPSLKGEDDIPDEIIGSLKVKRTAGRDRSFLNILEINYQNKYKADGQKVVQAIVDAYREYLQKSQAQNTEHIVQLIDTASNKIEKKLLAQKEGYLKFRQSAPLHWKSAPGPNGQQGEVTNVHQEMFIALERERQKNQLLITDAESQAQLIGKARRSGMKSEQIEEMVRGFLSSGAQGNSGALKKASPEELSLDNQLIALLLKEKELLGIYGDDYTEVKSIRKNIATTLSFYRNKGIRIPDTVLQNKVNSKDLVDYFVDSIELRIEELTKRDEILKQKSLTEANLSKSYSKYQLEEQTKSEQIQQTKKLYNTLIDRLGKEKLTEGNAGYSLKQISPVKSGLSIKRHLKILLAGLFVSIGSVAALAYLLTLRDTTIHSVEDIRDNIGYPVLGAVPEFNPDYVVDTVLPEYAALSPDLLYLHYPSSVVAESFRSVRTAMFFSAQTRGAKVIQVTSPLPGDGKTTISSNMAIATAQSNKRVLIIDADMRKPSLNTQFNLNNTSGLSDILDGKAELQDVVQKTAIENLTLLTTGVLPGNPAELLSSEKFHSLILEAKQCYDFVIIDTPPLLSVSDPCIISSQVDGLILVVRIMKSNRSAVIRTAELLEIHEATVLGVVANATLDGSQEAYNNAYGNGYSANVARRKDTVLSGNSSEKKTTL